MQKMTSHHDGILGSHSIRLAISLECAIATSIPEKLHTQFPLRSLSVRHTAVLNQMSIGTCPHTGYLCRTGVHTITFLKETLMFIAIYLSTVAEIC
jgi:hypothetical protein